MYTHGHICHFKQPKNPAESSAFSPQVLLPSNIRFNHMTSMFEFVRCCCAVSTTHIGKKGCGEATTGKSLRFRREFSRSRSRAQEGVNSRRILWKMSGCYNLNLKWCVVTVYIYYTYMVWYNIFCLFVYYLIVLFLPLLLLLLLLQQVFVPWYPLSPGDHTWPQPRPHASLEKVLVHWEVVVQTTQPSGRRGVRVNARREVVCWESFKVRKWAWSLMLNSCLMGKKKPHLRNTTLQDGWWKQKWNDPLSTSKPSSSHTWWGSVWVWNPFPRRRFVFALQ